MNRNTVSQGIKIDFAEQRNQLRSRLSKVSYLTLTTDIWSASNKSNRPYCTYSIHFMENEGMNYAILDYKKLPHNASNLQKSHSDLFAYYDIEDKVVSITADSASNNNASIRLLNSLRSMANLKAVTCFCNQLNLVVQFCTEIESSTIGRARNVCKTIKLSGSLQQKLHAKYIELRVAPRKIALDVKTRWNSLYTMVEILILLKSPINQLLRCARRSMESFKVIYLTNDWFNLSQVLKGKTRDALALSEKRKDLPRWPV